MVNWNFVLYDSSLRDCGFVLLKKQFDMSITSVIECEYLILLNGVKRNENTEGA